MIFSLSPSICTKTKISYIFFSRSAHTAHMVNVLIRTIVLYFTLIVSMRLMGKRQIGEVQISEFIVTIMLSEIAATPILDQNIPLSNAICAMLLLLSIELLVSYLLLKSGKLKRLICGTPSIIIGNGKLDQREMKKNRIDIEELFSELRQKGYSSIAEINYAILEENGQLSVFPYTKKAPATAEALSLSPAENGVDHLCVADGKILDDNLKTAGWTNERLERELISRRLPLSDIFILTIDDRGNIYIVKKK